MTPAKIKEHEPTAVKREMTEKIGKTGTDAQEASDLARKKGMAKHCWCIRDWATNTSKVELEQTDK